MTNSGIGTVTGGATRFSDAVITVEGAERKIGDLPLAGTYRNNEAGDTTETAECVVPVEWEATVSAQGATWKPGMFANQNSACKLSKQFTIDIVVAEIGVSSEV